MGGLDRASQRQTTLELALARSVQAPAQARAAVAAQLREAAVEESRTQTIVLLVSELVTNAVRHSSAPPDASIELSSSIDGDTVRVAVTDAGEGFVPRPRDPERLGEGYGLYLLEKSSRAWGVQDGDGTTVWFELDRFA